MDDMMANRPDMACLFAEAAAQHGHFTNAQAHACGFSRALLAHHAGHGRFRRIRRGLYRLRDFPDSPNDEVVAAWLGLGKDVAVVSHETALDILGLADIIPTDVHLTVPRSRRNLPDLPGAIVHTTTRMPKEADIVVRDGIRVTSPSRTILDVAEAGAAPEQVEMAVRQAISRGLVVPDKLVAAARERSKRVLDLVANAVAVRP